MKRLSVKIFLGLFVILLIISGKFLTVKVNEYKKQKIIYASSLSLIETLKNDLTSGFINNGIKINAKLISSDMNDSIVEIFPDERILPALVVYIPFANDICTSCIEFAIGRVKSHFSNFTSNPHILIIYSKFFPPGLNERRIQKKLYHFLSSELSFGIPADSIKSPHYFIISKDKKIEFFFSPNSLFPEVTEKYLERIKKEILPSNTY